MQSPIRILTVYALRWIPRITLAIFTLSLLAPAPPRAILGAPQTVVTQHPQLCVHTRLIDEVEEWKIQRSLQMVREMGADTIVEFFPWAYIESNEGEYHWENVDRIVRHAENQGIQIIARMGFVPAWAQPDHGGRVTLNTLPEDRFDAFAGFVAAFAGRYAGIINRLIIWNEPNLAFEWGYREVSPEGYARLLEVVYPAAHEANENVEILAAPLAPNLEPPGSPTAMNDLGYLRALYAAGASANFDALAMHTYGFTQPASEMPDSSRLNYRRAELLREIMVEHGDFGKPVYITEMGWNDSDRWAYAVSPSDRIAYTLQAYEIAEANWDWASKVCNWVLRYPAPTYSYPDRFTLLDTEFQPHPLYNTLQSYSRGGEVGENLWYPAPTAH
ncbi:MAG: cellulase family glycosylhydrolase [Anaerolineae bacterium]|nr:cellulase family glycosylhydrolase [Anaerolineae bacterium]